MNFIKGLTQLASNEQAQNLFSAARNAVSEMTNRTNQENKIEKLSDNRLKKMLKLDNHTNFSCYSESVSGQPVFHAVFIPESKSIWKSFDEKAVRKLCSKLNPLADISKEKSNTSAKLAELMEVVWREHDWAALHYAVACGLNVYLKNMIEKDPEITLNYATPDGRFPLNIAAEMGQLDSLRLLLNAGAALNQQDAMGRTVVHWASAYSTPILQELCCSPSFHPCLLSVDGDGLTPLASAIRNANFESVQLLIGISAPLGPLASGPLLNTLVGMKYSDSMGKILELITTVSPSVVEQIDSNGRTVLHKALDRKILSSVLKNSHAHIDMDKRDKAGATALLMAVERGDLECVICLLSYGSSVNSVDLNGVSSIMKAIQAGNTTLVKCLILFGADLSLKNVKGENVFKYSEASKKRAEIESLLTIAIKGVPQNENDRNALEDFSQKLALEYGMAHSGESNTVNVLSLDGGGIRGLVLIQILLELESLLGENVMSHFHWLAGTSTGAILALALSQGKTLPHCRNLYFRLKDEVFCGKRPFSSDSLEKLLQLEYGEETTMKAVSSQKRVLVTTCRANISPPELKLLRSYQLPLSEKENIQLGFSDPSKTKAWFAARCSSAAPTYFSPVEGQWMDGGLMANNPTADVLSDIQQYNTACRMTGNQVAVRVGCVLSLGTGFGPPISVESVNLSAPSDFLGFVKAFDSIVHLKNLLIEQIACAEGVSVTRSRSWSHTLPAPFFRLSPALSANIELDETNDVTLINMLWETKVYVASHSQSTQQLKDFLLKKNKPIS